MQVQFKNLKLARLRGLNKDNIKRIRDYIQHNLANAKVDMDKIDKLAGTRDWLDHRQVKTVLRDLGCNLSDQDTEVAMHCIQPSHPDRVSAKTLKACLAVRPGSSSRSQISDFESALLANQSGRSRNTSALASSRLSARSVPSLHSAGSRTTDNRSGAETGRTADGSVPPHMSASMTAPLAGDGASRGFLPVLRSSKSNRSSPKEIAEKVEALKFRMGAFKGNPFRVFHSSAEKSDLPLISKPYFVERITALGLGDAVEAHQMFDVLKTPYAEFLDHRSFFREPSTRPV